MEVAWLLVGHRFRLTEHPRLASSGPHHTHCAFRPPYAPPLHFWNCLWIRQRPPKRSPGCREWAREAGVPSMHSAKSTPISRLLLGQSPYPWTCGLRGPISPLPHLSAVSPHISDLSYTGPGGRAQGPRLPLHEVPNAAPPPSKSLPWSVVHVKSPPTPVMHFIWSFERVCLDAGSPHRTPYECPL